MADAVTQQPSVTERAQTAAADAAGAALQKLVRLAKPDVELQTLTSAADYQKLFTQLKDTKSITVKDKAGADITVTVDEMLEGAKKQGQGVYDAAKKQLQDVGIIETPGQLSSSQEKGREAYGKTIDMVTEQVAILLKKDNNLQKISILADQVIIPPKTNDEYIKVAKDLIEKREFEATLPGGGKKIIKIEDLDKGLAELAKSPDPKDKDLFGSIISKLGGAKTLEEAIPDGHKRNEIAKAVAGSVQENTGDIKWLGGASFMNALMGLLKWVFSGFEGTLTESIAKQTADSIASDTAAKLAKANTGLSAENIKLLSAAAGAKVRESAGYADRNAPVVATLDSIPFATTTVTATQAAAAAQDTPAPDTLDRQAPVKPAVLTPPVAGQVDRPLQARQPDRQATVRQPTGQADRQAQARQQAGQADSQQTSTPSATLTTGHATAPKPAETEKLIDNIARKMLSSSAGQAEISPESINAAKKVLIDQFKLKDIQDLAKAGKHEELGKKLSSALLKDDKSYAAILEYMKKNGNWAERKAANKVIEYGESAKAPFVYIAEGTIAEKIGELVVANKAGLQTAISQDAAAGQGTRLAQAGASATGGAASPAALAQRVQGR